MRPTTTDCDRSWTLSAPTLSPAELDTALARALGDEIDPRCIAISDAGLAIEAGCTPDDNGAISASELIASALRLMQPGGSSLQPPYDPEIVAAALEAMLDEYGWLRTGAEADQ